MQPTFDSIEPKLVWKHFLEINAIPRASKKEEKIIAHMVDFGKKLGLKKTFIFLFFKNFFKKKKSLFFKKKNKKRIL